MDKHTSQQPASRAQGRACMADKGIMLPGGICMDYVVFKFLIMSKVIVKVKVILWVKVILKVIRIFIV